MNFKFSGLYGCIVIAFLLLQSLTSCAQPAEKNNGLKWYTNLDEAQILSNTSKKPIFGFFTGSDWCGWCKKLQAEVFAKPEFVAWAKKNVILLELDYPRAKEQSPEIKQQNASLQQTFQVRGYPTCWLFYVKDNAETKQKSIEAMGSGGYPQGATPGKEEVKFLEDMNKIMADYRAKNPQAAAPAAPKKISKKKKN
jgi:protein disulfide-isomerase